MTARYLSSSAKLPAVSVPLWAVNDAGGILTSENFSGGRLKVVTAGIPDGNFYSYHRNPVDFAEGDSVRWSGLLGNHAAIPDAYVDVTNNQNISLGATGAMVRGATLLVRAHFTGLSNYLGANAAKIILNGGLNNAKRWSLGFWANQINEEENGDHVAMDNTVQHDWTFIVKDDDTLDVYLDSVFQANLVGGGNPGAPNGTVDFTVYGAITSDYQKRSISLPAVNLFEVLFGSESAAKSWHFRLSRTQISGAGDHPVAGVAVDATVSHIYEAVVKGDLSVDVYVDGVFQFNMTPSYDLAPSAIGDGFQAVNFRTLSLSDVRLSEFGYSALEQPVDQTTTPPPRPSSRTLADNYTDLLIQQYRRRARAVATVRAAVQCVLTEDLS